MSRPDRRAAIDHWTHSQWAASRLRASCTVFCERLLGHVLVEAQSREQPVEFSILVLQLLQPVEFGRAHTLVSPTQLVERLLANPERPPHRHDGFPTVCLLQRGRDLLLRKPTLLHRQPALPRAALSKIVHAASGPVWWCNVTRQAQSSRALPLLSDTCVCACGVSQ
jgi:hypothetical protein